MPHRLVELDVSLFQWINGHHAPPLDLVMKALSYGTELFALWWAVILVLLFLGKRFRRTAAALAVTLVVQGAIVDGAMKHVARRERPYKAVEEARQMGVPWGGYSFPSGHASSCFAAATVLSSAFPAAAPLLFLFAVTVAYSRVYLGMHYPSDVLTGAVIGILIALAVLRLFRKRKVAE